MSAHLIPMPVRPSGLRRSVLVLALMIAANVCGGFIAYVAYANYPAVHACETAKP